MRKEKRDFYIVQSNLKNKEKINEKLVLQPLKMETWLKTSGSLSKMADVQTYLVNFNKKITLNNIVEETGLKTIKKDIMRFRKKTYTEIRQAGSNSDEEVSEEVEFGGKVLIIKNFDLIQQYNKPQYINNLENSFFKFCQRNNIEFIIHYINDKSSILKIHPEKIRIIKNNRRQRPEKIDFTNNRI